MSHTLVLATAISPLHADLMIVRLRRSGIAASSISALHAHSVGSTSAFSWLLGTSRLPLTLEKKIFVSGPLRLALAEAGTDDDDVTTRLTALGVDSEHARTFSDALMHHRIVLCAQTRDENDLDQIVATFRMTDAEGITLADPGSHCPAPADFAALEAVT